MSQDRDYLLALELQNEWNKEFSDNDIEEIPDSSPPKKAKSASKYRSNKDEDYLNRTNNLVHPQWEVLDPTPDTQAMFQAFDDKFFQKRLRCVTLEWSKRMYSCAGICYSRRNGLGMAITIRLSEPLLKLRSRKDLVETMLHEMIHAYCFVLGIREGNGGHGPNFKKIMTGINKVAGTNITVYHTFHDEVDVYKTHWWRCNGICQHRSPFYGYVRRTSNRAPGPNDNWWIQHHNSCGGTFMKIKEPEKPAKKSKSKAKAIEANNVKASERSSGTDLRKFFPPTNGRRPGGPVKTNGGGTLLLNPKTSRTNITEPKESRVPSPIRKSGNLANVVGFKDLDADAPRHNPTQPRDFSMTGKGYSLTGSGAPPSVDKGVDKNHLRDVWLKRFATSTETTQSQPKDDEEIAGNAKRRRLSEDSAAKFVADEAAKKIDWVVIDEDVMVHEVENKVISISSSEDEDDSTTPPSASSTPRKQMVFADSNARQRQIKKEILDESIDLCEGNEDDIDLIDDEYDDDDILNSSIDLADTSLVDDLFGEDTLLKDFKTQNAVVPSCSRYSNDPLNDIITCPICQEKMKRSNFEEHLNGCVGISEKIELPKRVKNKPKESEPRNRRASLSSRTREILLSAGYTEEDIRNIPPTSDTSSTSPSDDDLNLSDRERRSRGLYTTTRPCPACFREVEIDRINEHLDECLQN